MNPVGRLGPIPEPVDDPLWRLEVVGYDPLREREFESWFAVANGRTGTRASVEESSPESSPAVYLAGVFGRSPDQVPGPELLTGPNWVFLSPRLDDDLIVQVGMGEVLEHRRLLDLRRGILFRVWRQRLQSGEEITFRSARFASQSDRALAALVAEGIHERQPLSLSGDIPLPSTPALERMAFDRRGDRQVVELVGRSGGSATFGIQTREAEGRLERIAAVSRQTPWGPPERSVAAALDLAQSDGLAALCDQHCRAWQERWDEADVIVEGDPDAQLALRFALYHLISAGDPESDLSSIGARGLTGPGYFGHVFWDTDVFMLPVFIHTQPEVARRLIGYRFRTLSAARARARKLGYRGALYAWESADDGQDCTPPLAVDSDGTVIPILTGLQEHHISADVAWSVWRYWEATHDEGLLLQMGAEIILETARFWSTRVRRGRDSCHHIDPVIGPDEYHEGVRDNAFTNFLAKWNLERGREVAELLSRADPAAWNELTARLELHPDELERWRLVAGSLVDQFDPDSLLYEQFDGFFDLEDVTAADLAPRPFLGDLVLGRERLRGSQVIKQADVVMLMHMLPEAFPAEVVLANYRYYEPRTSHGSSLSPAVHAAVAARLGLHEDALDYFRMAAAIDLGDRMGNAAQGIHMAAAAGLWQAAVLGFGGVGVEAEWLRINPRLPAEWSRLAFPVKWRGNALRIAAGKSDLEIELDGPANIALGDELPRRLSRGRYRTRREGSRWAELAEVDTAG